VAASVCVAEERKDAVVSLAGDDDFLDAWK